MMFVDPGLVYHHHLFGLYQISCTQSIAGVFCFFSSLTKSAFKCIYYLY